MRILNVTPAGYRLVTEFELSEFEMIVKALDGTELRYDYKDVEKTKAVEFLTKELYPKIEKLIKEIRSGP